MGWALHVSVSTARTSVSSRSSGTFIILLALVLRGSFVSPFPNHPNRVTNDATGMEWSLIRTPILRNEAAAQCTQNGGFLGVVHNEKENRFISRLCANTSYLQSASGLAAGCWFGPTRSFDINACSQPAAADGTTLKNTAACRTVNPLLVRMSGILVTIC
jgi:hypothetical protein